MREHKIEFTPFITLLAALVLAGCSSTYSFKVDAINNPDPNVKELKSYKIVSSNAQINEDDLEFQEVSQYIKTALSGKGYYEAPAIDNADMVIDVSYGVSEPQTDFKTKTSPAYGRSSGGYKTISTPVIDRNGNVRYVNSTVFTPPRVEMIGVQEQIVPIITYEKYLRMTSRDNRDKENNENPTQVWSIYVKNKDESENLRKYIPLMAAAAIPYVGENTENQQEIKIKEEDDIVDFVKKGL